MYIVWSNAILSQIVLSGNEAESGGGIYSLYSYPSISSVILTDNQAHVLGGGMYMSYSSSAFDNSVIAYNRAQGESNILNHQCYYNTEPYYCDYYYSLTLNNSILYNPSSIGNDTYVPKGSFLTIEPKFLTYSEPDGTSCIPGSSSTCMPDDLHLAVDSPAIDAGNAGQLDPDGTSADIGVYGGALADQWDQDGDGYPDYFWPGSWLDIPDVDLDQNGAPDFRLQDFDCDDLDPDVHFCN
jgi:hypothetical protein